MRGEALSNKEVVHCECGAEVLVISIDPPYPEVNIAMFRLGEQPPIPSIWQRLKYAWQHVRTGHKHEDQMILSADEAYSMASILHDFATKSRVWCRKEQ